MALELERQGYIFYRDCAARAADSTTASLYKALQHEENEHIDFLQNTIDYLEDTGNWLLWEERGLLDGG